MRRVVLTTVAAIVVLAASGGSALADNGSELRQELAEARAATAKYHYLDAALADGYVPFGYYQPNVGLRHNNSILLADGFDPTAPERLLYAPALGRGLRLVGLEYIVESPTAPSGCAGSRDRWMNLGAGIWGLHVWLWQANPDGLFSYTNPNIP